MADAPARVIATSGKLLKRLGFAFAAAVGLGSMIGAGLMRTSGSVIDEVPYPWLVIALWAFGGVHALLLAFIAADPVSALYMAALIAICIPVGIFLHRRRTQKLKQENVYAIVA